MLRNCRMMGVLPGVYIHDMRHLIAWHLVKKSGKDVFHFSNNETTLVSLNEILIANSDRSKIFYLF